MEPRQQTLGARVAAWIDTTKGGGRVEPSGLQEGVLSREKAGVEMAPEMRKMSEMTADPSCVSVGLNCVHVGLRPDIFNCSAYTEQSRLNNKNMDFLV